MGPRILVVHPELTAAGGGGCALTAHALEGLSRRFETEVLTRRPLDLAALDRTFGTRLAGRGLVNLTFAPWTSAAWAAAPALCERVRRALTARECRRHRAARGHAALVSTNEEVDFGGEVRGVQYVNWPLTDGLAHVDQRRWYHAVRPLSRIYRGAVELIAPWDRGRVAGNATMANSEFSAAAVRRAYGIEPAIVYPPVPGDFPVVPWEARRRSFVCLGRLSIMEKDLLKVVEVVARVRARGHDVGLDLVGTPATPADLARLRDECARRGPWLALHEGLDRAALVQLVASRRYGLHGNAGEHFGIAVGEYVRAGLVPFVPDVGGCAEIVGADPRFTYGSLEDAVAKIARALEDPAHEAGMRELVAARRDHFSVERFQDELVRFVDRALQG